MKPTLSQAKHFLRAIPETNRRTAYKWAIDTGYFAPKGPRHVLISPQGHVEYNARFVVGDDVEKLEPGRWYTPEELAAIHGVAHFLRESPQCVEKNVKKWRYERQ